MTMTEPSAEVAKTNGVRPERPMPTNVIQAIARITEELPGIGREEKSEQGYSYRGIEAITRHAAALLGRYCVVFVPRVVNRTVKDLTINNRPWTEDHLEVVYTVYGPGGVEDRIEVGPLFGLGRDNSDKGANKAMTQAYKYALVQTFCIGDGKDDPDRDVAHEADPLSAPVDMRAEERIALRTRINDLSVDARKVLGSWCDDHEIPRRTADMTEAQIERVNLHLDMQEESGADPETGEMARASSAPMQEVVDAVAAMKPAEIDQALAARHLTVPDDLQRAALALTDALYVEAGGASIGMAKPESVEPPDRPGEAAVVPQERPDPPAATDTTSDAPAGAGDDLVDAITAQVAQMASGKVMAELVRLGLPTEGPLGVRKDRLVQGIYEARIAL